MRNGDLNNLVKELRQNGVSEEEIKLLEQQLKKDFEYIPKVGVFGKTGAGKSSLINAVFGKDVCGTSDVEACTRELQEQNVGGVILIDCPGLAESKERDEEYYEMYSKLIPTLDAILWVLKGDDRAYAEDLKAYELIKKCFKYKNGKEAPFFFVLNQVDKIEPFREWDEDLSQPGDKQSLNIDKKIKSVASDFDITPSKVIPVSAQEKYNLSTLIVELLGALPANQALIMSSDINEERCKQQKEIEEKIKILQEQAKKHEEEAEKAKQEADEERRRVAEAKAQLKKEKARRLRERREIEDENIYRKQREKADEYEKNIAEKIGRALKEDGEKRGGVSGMLEKVIGKGFEIVGSWFHK